MDDSGVSPSLGLGCCTVCSGHTAIHTCTHSYNVHVCERVSVLRPACIPFEYHKVNEA